MSNPAQFIEMIQPYLPHVKAVATFTFVSVVGTQIADHLESKNRMNFVTLQRDRMRKRERDRIVDPAANNKANLRSSTPGAFAKQIVDKLDLRRWLSSESVIDKLNNAGFRGLKAETTFLIARLLCPIGGVFAATTLIVALSSFALSLMVKALIYIACVYMGLKLPELYLNDLAKKRRGSMMRAFPDAMDLLLISVESGMSIEAAFRKVSQEIGNTSIPLAEELLLTTAELSFLPDRRLAYENLYKRTEIEAAKSLSTVLVQAEKYGTSLGAALRVLSQDSREQRMQAAEKKAAGLSPKLTVPMILFFLPALFIIILTPALIQIFKWT
jgi:tight adherence protein C